MSNAIPQDSILRRHFEQHLASQGVSSVPQDSILARHHAQLMAARNSADTASAASVQTPVAPKSPSVAPDAAATPARSRPVPPPAATPQKGFFAGLLDMLFGRK